MAKSFYCVVFIACFLTASKPDSLADIFKDVLQVDSLLASANNVSQAIYGLTSEVYKLQEDTNIKNFSLIASSLKATVKPYADLIKEASLLANNPAAKTCVRKAELSLQRLITSGSQVSYACAMNIRIQLYNFTTFVASLDIGEDSSLGHKAFSAVTKCPDRFLTQTVTDLSNAKTCYLEAVIELTNLINITTNLFLQLQDDLNILQTNARNCILNQSEIALKEVQPAINKMVSCRKTVAAMQLPRNVFAVFNTNLEDIENLVWLINYNIPDSISDAKRNTEHMRNFKNWYNTTIQHYTKYTRDEIDLYEKHMKELDLYKNWTAKEVQCVDDAIRSLYDHDMTHFIECVSNAENRFNSYNFLEKTLRAAPLLKVVAANISVEAVFKCTSSSQVTEESVTSCLTDVLEQGRNRSRGGMDIMSSGSRGSEVALHAALGCLSNEYYHNFPRGKAIVEQLHKCMEEWSKNNGFIVTPRPSEEP